MDSNENSFWKQNRRAVPGRPSPKKLDQQLNRMDKAGARSGVGSTSFQDFQQSVSDAWDTGDDEFCILSGMAGNYSKTQCSWNVMGVNI